MPNYYYDAPPDFTPDETLEIVVPMEQPPEGYVYSSYFASSAIFRKRGCKMLSRGLPVRVGTRVGVREAWFNYFTDNSGKTYFRDTAPHIPYSSFDEPETMPDDAIRHWYTVTEVDVVYDGQWVEKVTMRRVR